jgi:hypothetical protein
LSHFDVCLIFATDQLKTTCLNVPALEPAVTVRKVPIGDGYSGDGYRVEDADPDPDAVGV